MHQRPIKILVDALRELGADISYLEAEGCPPLEIKGKILKGGKVSVSGEVSSQFISALLLCGSRFQEGLELELIPPITSRPYIGLTMAAMTRAGIRHQMEGNTITVPAQKGAGFELSMERDWSAAAFGYGLMALGCCEELLMPGLTVKTWQGDSILGQLYAMLGVQTGESELGIHLIKKTGPPPSFAMDMSDCPDLAQPVVFTCAALGVECDLWGLHTLPMKETDRIKAMAECLAQVGIKTEHGPDFIRFKGKISASTPPHFKTYKDHRMAMSLALWAPVLGELSLEDASVVSKSFPNFWVEVEKMGVVSCT
jgi:3-phosphoshikimate 1-carboxyvinyltransferase